MKLNGYVIVPPLSPWNEKHKEQIWLGNYSSFETSAVKAWRRYTGNRYNKSDLSIIIQRYHDRGYRVKKATLEIHDE